MGCLFFQLEFRPINMYFRSSHVARLVPARAILQDAVERALRYLKNMFGGNDAP